MIKIKQNNFVIMMFFLLMFLLKHKSIGYAPMPDNHYVFLRINSRHFLPLKHLVYGGPDGELGASLRYLSQRFSMPNEITKATLNDIGSSCSKCSHIHLPVLLHNLRQISRYMGAD